MGWNLKEFREQVAARDRVIASLEAERDKAVELLKEPCLCGEENDHRDSMGAWICKPCFDKQKFLASIGGEVKK